MTNTTESSILSKKIMLKTVEEETAQILAKYKISEETGVLAQNPIRHLPLVTGNYARDKYFMAIEQIAYNLPYYIKNRKMAELVQNLPSSDWPVNDLPEKVVFFLMLQCAMVAHAFFREILPYKNIGELVADKSTKTLPKVLAVPLWKLHKITGIAPSMSYCLYSLWNYRLKDLKKGFEFDNIALILSFTGDESEEHFVKIHQKMEFESTPSYKFLVKAALLAEKILFLEPMRTPIWLLDEFSETLKKAGEVGEGVVDFLEHMRDKCDPKNYFDKVRMFYGFPLNVVYEEVKELEDEPQNFLGETGGHTPLMQFWNFVLGVQLDKIQYYRKMREHMRLEHREFVLWTKKSKIRKAVIFALKRFKAKPARWYNRMLFAIIDWRREHWTDVYDYISSHGETHGSGKPELTWLYKLYRRTLMYIVK